MEVSSTSSKTGVAHEYGYGQPVAPAHDRGHEWTQALRWDAEGPYSQLQAVCYVSQAVPWYGHRGGHPPVSTASFRDGREHLPAQPHHDRGAGLVSRDVAAPWASSADLCASRTPEA